MALTNFEDLTYELTSDEIKIIIPYIIKGFKGFKEGEKRKADGILADLNRFLKEKNIDHIVTANRFSKMVKYIRNKGILPIIATSAGHYISYDHEECYKQAKSLYERAVSSMAAARKFGDSFIGSNYIKEIVIKPKNKVAITKRILFMNVIDELKYKSSVERSGSKILKEKTIKS